jgi:hypothetical protein
MGSGPVHIESSARVTDRMWHFIIIQVSMCIPSLWLFMYASSSHKRKVSYPKSAPLEKDQMSNNGNKKWLNTYYLFNHNMTCHPLTFLLWVKWMVNFRKNLPYTILLISHSDSNPAIRNKVFFLHVSSGKGNQVRGKSCVGIVLPWEESLTFDWIFSIYLMTFIKRRRRALKSFVKPSLGGIS